MMDVAMDKLQLYAVVLCLLTVRVCGNQEPVIDQYPLTGIVNTIEGNSTYIACYIRAGDPRPTVTWYKHGEEVHTGEVLRFEDIRSTDNGTYKCVMSNSVSTKQQKFTVTVYRLQVDYGFVGYPARLKYKNSLTGVKLVKWYNIFMPWTGEAPQSEIVVRILSSVKVKDQRYDYDSTTGDLVIPTTSLDMEGNYTLRVSDFQSTSWSFNRFYVYVQPSDIKMESFPDFVIEDVEVTAVCVVHRVKPANVTFSWSFGENVLSSHTEAQEENSDRTFKVTSTLRTKFVRRDDQQLLRCKVEHGVNTMLTSQDEKKVLVYYEYQTKVLPKNAGTPPVEGGQKTFVCHIAGEGKPTSSVYKWYKGSTELHNYEDKYSGADTNELLTQNLNSEDEGEYGCQIQNLAGPGTRVATYPLEVWYEPRVELSGPSTVTEGDDVTITCSVDAKPDFTSMNWYLNDQLLPKPQRDEAEYVLSPVLRSSKGRYMCEVTNEIGTTSQSLQLRVLYKPTGQPTVEPSQLVMKVDTKQNLECKTDSLKDIGNPPPTQFVWMRDDTVLEHQTAIVEIAPNLVTDGASYLCAVKNDIGQSTFSNLTVVSVEAPVNIEGNPGHVEYMPQFDDASFVINFTISGGSNLQTNLQNSSNPVSTDDFVMIRQEVAGTFPYGQISATQVSYVWKVDQKDLTRCSHVTYFNGDYSFQASGTVAGVQTSKTAVFRIAVQYPAMWKAAGHKESSATDMEKTLLCDVCSNPAPDSIVWSFKGGELPVGVTEEGGKLHIARVTLADFGMYTCTVYNNIKQKEFDRTFNIMLEEKGSPHNPQKLTVASQTSETLLVTWSPGFDGGYDLMGYELDFRTEGATEWETHGDKQESCTRREHLCKVRLMNLKPSTKYSFRLRAKNSRPSMAAEDPYSNYVSTEGQTKALPAIKFLPTEITEDSLTVQWTLETDGEERRRRRDTSSDSEVGLEVYYKAAADPDYKRYPENTEDKIPATAERAVIPGKFDVQKPYDVQVAVYEGEFKVNRLSNDVSTSAFAQPHEAAAAGTGTIAGVVVGIFVAVILIAGGVFIWHRRRASKGSEVELRRKANVGYLPVNNAASMESLPYHPPLPTAEPPTPTRREMPRPPMPRPLKAKPAPRAAPNGQPFKESPYVNVTAGGEPKARMPTADDNESLYENVPKAPQYENVSFHSRHRPPPDGAGNPLYDEVSQGKDAQLPDEKKNMIYTDVAFDPPPRRTTEASRVHIHGKENRVDYADLDFTKMATKQKSESQI